MDNNKIKDIIFANEIINKFVGNSENNTNISYENLVNNKRLKKILNKYNKEEIFIEDDELFKLYKIINKNPVDYLYVDLETTDNQIIQERFCRIYGLADF